MKLGTSLSLCVSEILRTGKIPETPYVLVAGTRMASPEVCYEHYGDSYFSDYEKDVVMGVLRKVWPHIIQPRNLSEFGPRYGHYAGTGEWVELGDDPAEVWKYLDGCCNNPDLNQNYNTLEKQAILEAEVIRCRLGV